MKLLAHLWLAQSLLTALVFISPALQADSADQTHRHHSVHGTDHEHDVLEEVLVTATPLSRNLIEMPQSATVLKGAILDREVANNIGDTLSRIPGLSNASFGQNVGRPVTRGLQGAWVC